LGMGPGITDPSSARGWEVGAVNGGSVGVGTGVAVRGGGDVAVGAGSATAKPIGVGVSVGVGAGITVSAVPQADIKNTPRTPNAIPVDRTLLISTSSTTQSMPTVGCRSGRIGLNSRV
jgi:hypothetical protein